MNLRHRQRVQLPLHAVSDAGTDRREQVPFGVPDRLWVGGRQRIASPDARYAPGFLVWVPFTPRRTSRIARRDSDRPWSSRVPGGPTPRWSGGVPKMRYRYRLPKSGDLQPATGSQNGLLARHFEGVDGEHLHRSLSGFPTFLGLQRKAYGPICVTGSHRFGRRNVLDRPNYTHVTRHTPGGYGPLGNPMRSPDRQPGGCRPTISSHPARRRPSG